MANLIIVDDDYGLEILVETLQFSGHEVRRFGSVAEALNEIATIAAADLLFLDVIMPPSIVADGNQISGGRTTGMTVYGSTRKLNPKLPILAYTASVDPVIKAVFERDSHARFISKWSTPRLEEILLIVEEMLGIKPSKRIPPPFIVHGQDEKTKLEVKNYLQNTLKLPEPIILHEQPSLGRTIIEKFEHYSARSQLAFVVLTPDDRVIAT